MFRHPFFLQHPYFTSLLEQYNDREPPLLRFTGFMLFAHEIFGWFSANSDLASLKLTCVTLPHVEKNPLSIRLRHHFKLDVRRGEIGKPALVDNLDHFVMDTLPYQHMSHGSFELERIDTLVSQFIELPSGQEAEYNVMVYALAQRLDLAFDDVSIVHDLGMTAPLAS